MCVQSYHNRNDIRVEDVHFMAFLNLKVPVASTTEFSDTKTL